MTVYGFLFCFVKIYSKIQICNYNGVIYNVGEVYTKGESGCTVCTCSIGMVDKCYTVKSCNNNICDEKSKILIPCCEKLGCSCILLM